MLVMMSDNVVMIVMIMIDSDYVVHDTWRDIVDIDDG